MKYSYTDRELDEFEDLDCGQTFRFPKEHLIFLKVNGKQFIGLRTGEIYTPREVIHEVIRVEPREPIIFEDAL